MPKNINALHEIYIFLLIGSFHNQVYHRTLTCLKKGHPKIAYLPNLIWTEYFFQQICDLTALHIFNPVWACIDLQWYGHQPSLLKALYSQDIESFWVFVLFFWNRDRYLHLFLTTSAMFCFGNIVFSHHISMFCSGNTVFQFLLSPFLLKPDTVHSCGLSYHRICCPLKSNVLGLGI